MVDGLGDGRIAVFTKMHHATVDGVSGASLLSHLCSLEPHAPPAPGERPDQERVPSDLELAARAAPRTSFNRTITGHRAAAFAARWCLAGITRSRPMTTTAVGTSMRRSQGREWWRPEEGGLEPIE